ncbi:hypothetical protein NUW54_g6599 [Trametes sanguinea]|uniref:Uncharacterized protein n=1 Tax=Trametes sanguinea TaxID=158606 RepID=A0ACC1PRW0_9APHY|nr:hypothetical protein NUW54_g6599 [Trametes sanguinea]
MGCSSSGLSNNIRMAWRLSVLYGDVSRHCIHATSDIPLSSRSGWPALRCRSPILAAHLIPPLRITSAALLRIDSVNVSHVGVDSGPLTLAQKA